MSDPTLDEFAASLVPPALDRTTVSERREAIENAVKAKTASVGLIESGSWSHGTSLKGHSDVDYMSFIPGTSRPTLPSTALSSLKQAIAGAHWSIKELGISSPTVKVTFYQPPHFEIVPADLRQEELSEELLRQKGIVDVGIWGADWHDFNAAQHGVFRVEQIMIYTVNGAGVTMWDTYAADMARELCEQFPCFAWQPVGYDNKPVPMKPGIEQGTAEFVRLLTEVHPAGRWMGIFYSEGAIIGANVLDLLRNPASPIAHRLSDLLAVCAYGNPRREEGHTFPGGIPVSGRGIVEPNLVDTPDWWWDFANGDEIPGSGGEDLYATTSDATGTTRKDMTAIWKIVYNGNVGPLAKQVGKAIIMPWRWIPAIKATSKAAKFFGTGTWSHCNYHVSYPIVGDSRDSWRVGFDYLAERGWSHAQQH